MKTEHRTETCAFPSTWLRRIGSVWVCPTCHTIYTLRRFGSIGGNFKAWTEVER